VLIPVRDRRLLGREQRDVLDALRQPIETRRRAA